MTWSIWARGGKNTTNSNWVDGAPAAPLPPAAITGGPGRVHLVGQPDVRPSVPHIARTPTPAPARAAIPTSARTGTAASSTPAASRATPRPHRCDYRRLQALHGSVMIAGLADGSVRTVSLKRQRPDLAAGLHAPRRRSARQRLVGPQPPVESLRCAVCLRRAAGAAAVLALAVGCSSKPEMAQLSGTVTFKGKPVPAGWISFTPEPRSRDRSRSARSRTEFTTRPRKANRASSPARTRSCIAGFDGKKIPLWGQGKQIFNPVETRSRYPPAPRRRTS